MRFIFSTLPQLVIALFILHTAGIIPLHLLLPFLQACEFVFTVYLFCTLTRVFLHAALVGFFILVVVISIIGVTTGRWLDDWPAPPPLGLPMVPGQGR